MRVLVSWEASLFDLVVFDVDSLVDWKGHSRCSMAADSLAGRDVKVEMEWLPSCSSR